MKNLKERPILFSTDMVKANLDGRKTMTRRGFGKNNKITLNPDEYEFQRILKGSIDERGNREESIYAWFREKESQIEIIPFPCPYGKPGDILWVRETLFQNGELGLEYFADKEPIDNEIIPEDYGPYIDYSFRKIPSIYMSKWAARIWLEITDIKVERVHNISYEDSIKEGIYECWLTHNLPSEIFGSLWRDINGKKSWDLNPWVWVISYEILSTTGKPEFLKELAHAD